MQRLFVLLLIVLLPLRGLAGDLMSVHMATGVAASPAASAMRGDCPMHAQAGAAQHDAAPDPMPSGKSDCTSCVLCTPVAEATGLQLDVVTAVHAEPQAAGIDFLSAAQAPSFKPPIS